MQNYFGFVKNNVLEEKVVKEDDKPGKVIEIALKGLSVYKKHDGSFVIVLQKGYFLKFSSYLVNSRVVVALIRPRKNTRIFTFPMEGEFVLVREGDSIYLRPAPLALPADETSAVAA